MTRPEPEQSEGPFLLFAGDSYYAGGGFNDYHGEHASLEAAKEAALAATDDGGYADWWQIVDLPTRTIVAQRGHIQR